MIRQAQAELETRLAIKTLDCPNLHRNRRVIAGPFSYGAGESSPSIGNQHAHWGLKSHWVQGKDRTGRDRVRRHQLVAILPRHALQRYKRFIIIDHPSNSKLLYCPTRPLLMRATCDYTSIAL